MTEEARKLADKCEAWPNVNLQPEENRLIVAALRSQPGLAREEVAGIILYGIVDDWENGATTTETYQNAKRLSLQLADRIALSPSHEAGTQAVLDSYADENQRLSDEIEALKAKAGTQSECIHDAGTSGTVAECPTCGMGPCKERTANNDRDSAYRDNSAGAGNPHSPRAEIEAGTQEGVQSSTAQAEAPIGHQKAERAE